MFSRATSSSKIINSEKWLAVKWILPIDLKLLIRIQCHHYVIVPESIEKAVYTGCFTTLGLLG